MSSIIKKCEWCGIKFSTPNGIIQMFTGTAKFCSNKCEHEYEKCGHDYNDNNQEEEVISYPDYRTPQERLNWTKWRNGEMSDKDYWNNENDPSGNLQNYYFQELSKLFAKRLKTIRGEDYIDSQGNVYATSIIGGAEWTTTDYCYRDRYKNENIPFENVSDPEAREGYPMEYVFKIIKPTLKNGWRLPNLNDWKNLIDHFGGVPFASVFLSESVEYSLNGVYPDIPSNWGNSSEMNFTYDEPYWSFDDSIKYFTFSIKRLAKVTISENLDDEAAEWFGSNPIRLVRDVPIPVKKKKSSGESHSKKKVDKNEKKTELENLKNLWESGAITQEQYQNLKEEIELQKLNNLLKEGAISQEQFYVLIKSIDTPNKT